MELSLFGELDVRSYAYCELSLYLRAHDFLQILQTSPVGVHVRIFNKHFSIGRASLDR